MTIIILVGIVVLLVAFGYHIGYTTAEYDLREDLKACEIEKAELIQENQEIKKDVGMLLIEYYGVPVAWDFVGLTKYKKLACSLKIILKDKIPEVNKIPC